MAYQIKSFFNGYLAPGSRRIDAILSVTAEAGSNAVEGTGQRIVGIAIDASGSMFDDARKIEAAKRAARQGVRALPPDALFVVIAFADKAKIISPLRIANEANKAEAEKAIQALINLGGTYMSTPLKLFREAIAGHPDATAWLYFLTDGQNDGKDATTLQTEISACKSRFECDSRGIGTDWQPRDLRLISNALLGTADAVPNPQSLEADFRSALTRALSKQTGSVRLDLWRPGTCKLVSLRQMQPETIEITDQGEKLTERVTAFKLGAWAPGETRDYAAVFDIEPHAVNEDMLVCRPSLIYSKDGVETKVEGERIVAVWSGNSDLTARISDEVAHYTGQTELASSISEGMAAKSRGDAEEATRLLGRAAKIAHDSGNAEVTRRLSNVVDVVDADAGTVRLRKGVDKGAELELDMGSTRTVRRTKA